VQLRQVYPPGSGDVGIDAVTAYLPPVLGGPAGAAPAAPPVGRPWVTTNMVASVDGAMSLEGRSGGLGSEVDRIVFRSLRSVADAVMAGAGTVRTERYGPVLLDPERVAEREARGQAPTPTLVIVSNSGRLDDDLPLLDADLVGDGPLPIVLTCGAGEPAPRRLAGRVEVLVSGEQTVDLVNGLGLLAERGIAAVVCEGGPTLNGALVANGLLDELCLTIAPLLTAGVAGRIVGGVDEQPVRLELAHLLEAQGELFGRWRVVPDGDPVVPAG
jgi:riboflavin biosynthesis pyrimidine reductase